jgi:hypothetical protein
MYQVFFYAVGHIYFMLIPTYTKELLCTFCTFTRNAFKKVDLGYCLAAGVEDKVLVFISLFPLLFLKRKKQPYLFNLF